MIHNDALYPVIIDIIDTILFIFNHYWIVISPHGGFPLRHVHESMNLTDRFFDADPFLSQIRRRSLWRGTHFN